VYAAYRVCVYANMIHGLASRGFAVMCVGVCVRQWRIATDTPSVIPPTPLMHTRCCSRAAAVTRVFVCTDMIYGGEVYTYGLFAVMCVGVTCGNGAFRRRSHAYALLLEGRRRPPPWSAAARIDTRVRTSLLYMYRGICMYVVCMDICMCKMSYFMLYVYRGLMLIHVSMRRPLEQQRVEGVQRARKLNV
jgi:hypothetical protein